MADTDTGTDAGDEDLGDDSEFAIDNPNDNGSDAGAEGGQGDEPKPEELPPLAPDDIAKRAENYKKLAHQEREKRQAVEARARQAEERLQDMERQQQEAAQGARPDPNEDPIGYLSWLNDRVDRMDRDEREGAAQLQQRQQNERVVQDVIERTGAYEAEFRETNADYIDAMAFLNQARAQDFAVQGYAPDQAWAAVQQEVLSRAHRALTTGQDPAAVAYNLAKARGFGATKAADEGKAKLARIAEGQKAASPLASAGGRGNDELTLEGVNGLSGAAFMAAADKLERQMLRRERGF